MYLFSRASALCLDVLHPYRLQTTGVRLISIQVLRGQQIHTSKGHQVACVGSRQPLRGWGMTWEETMGYGLGFGRAGIWPLTLQLQNPFSLLSVGLTCKDVGQAVQACACPSWHSTLDGTPDSKSCLCVPGKGT